MSRKENLLKGVQSVLDMGDDFLHIPREERRKFLDILSEIKEAKGRAVKKLIPRVEAVLDWATINLGRQQVTLRNQQQAIEQKRLRRQGR